MVQNPKEKSQILEIQRFAIKNVPGAGIEPARIAPLVFETSASTDSAIRALRIVEVVPRLMLKVVDLLVRAAKIL